MTSRILSGAAVLVAVSTLSACGLLSTQPAFDQSSLPEAVKVPAGNAVALETVGVGEITYECRDKKDAAGQTEWVFVGPKAVLNDRKGKMVGSYYGPPATWESADGSKFTGTQVAVSPAAAGNIPLQLVKANPATGNGAFNGVTYVQRVATVGGVAPKAECSPATKGQKQVVQYQADYILYKASSY
ncbi:MAG: DUF3455 domain-containing protein [Limnobacter sp.]|uniref:DUF3455 domain-containing protein n=1 Tax=Limnobacter sp. TaxID=2003368 RepID=UPI00391B896A